MINGQFCDECLSHSLTTGILCFLFVFFFHGVHLLGAYGNKIYGLYLVSYCFLYVIIFGLFIFLHSHHRIVYFAIPSHFYFFLLNKKKMTPHISDHLSRPGSDFTTAFDYFIFEQISSAECALQNHFFCVFFFFTASGEKSEM